MIKGLVFMPFCSHQIIRQDFGYFYSNELAVVVRWSINALFSPFPRGRGLKTSYYDLFECVMLGHFSWPNIIGHTTSNVPFIRMSSFFDVSFFVFTATPPPLKEVFKGTIKFRLDFFFPILHTQELYQYYFE